MANFNKLLFVVLIGLALLATGHSSNQVECQEQVSVESRQQKYNDELNDTIKYLEKLDKMFSQLARPRFGRSGYKQQLQQPQQQQMRFGQLPSLSLANNNNLPMSEPQMATLTSLSDFINTRLLRKYLESNY